jgi:hypothetical protein
MYNNNNKVSVEAGDRTQIWYSEISLICAEWSSLHISEGHHIEISDWFFEPCHCHTRAGTSRPESSSESLSLGRWSRKEAKPMPSYCGAASLVGLGIPACDH